MRILAGICSILMGLFLILSIFAFASMVDPNLAGVAWWSEVLHKYRHQGEPGAVTLLGLMLVALGIYLCIGAIGKSKRSKLR